MKTISAIDAKTRFGQLLDTVQGRPVTVTKNGRPAAVMLSVEDYERMRGSARRRLLDTIGQTQNEAAMAGMNEDVLEQLISVES